ncbi:MULTISPECIES: type II toxin-antitoxin system RelE/ParE family toxin [unclassified Synechocystis]|uniref:type II toxin-antitoxin system RelE family toxin n=1 Tax=unclassified Synechocystis TaxID=2640012 RepID=UPI00042793FD|nr:MULTISPECIES: type II toxin-antitoxin system RelE/ParE family toxin [unclassified Synechocystis]AIE74117.1 RelE/StbE replicon stabilization toxin [Synechocystis sp. PCC 6714]MCT0252761.1 type II toxin-antitoxin system RelE/ParE family toxin [Synechocystis sp. CS-94]
MDVQYLPSFIKDLKKLKSSPQYELIKSLVLEKIPQLEQIQGISNVKKLKGEENAYPIRLGDYRIGFYIQSETIVLARVVHRREFYLYFP